jgi:xanthine dehydrogenase molybdopterin-binding subunit B
VCVSEYWFYFLFQNISGVVKFLSSKDIPGINDLTPIQVSNLDLIKEVGVCYLRNKFTGGCSRYVQQNSVNPTHTGMNKCQTICYSRLSGSSSSYR